MSAAKPGQRVVDIAPPALLEDKAFCTELSALAAERDISLEVAQEEVERCIKELAIEPRDRYLNWSARLARFMYSRSYDTELDVDREALDRLQQLAGNRPLVFLWSHKSHLDSFVFLRAIYDGNFRPQPLSFAGINMSFAGFGTLARNAGAIFLRRSFKGADIYKLVFRHYVRYLVAKRAPLSWSIEGTRSRTGKLMPPKPGLLQWVLEALEANGDDSALFVPVSITFDQIAEMDDYIAINRGEPKRKESLGWFLGYIFGMQNSAGKIHVRFGEPVSLQDPGEVPAALLQTSSDAKQAHTLQLALEVSRRMEHSTLVTPQSLVCLALLASEAKPLPLPQLQQRLMHLQRAVARAGLPCAAGLENALDTGLPEILDSLADSALLVDHGDQTWSVNPAKSLGASYYRNTISHFFLYRTLGELALAVTAHSGDSVNRESVGEAVLRWREILKFEYVFMERDESIAQALAHLDYTYPDWEQLLADGQSPFVDREPVYGRGILLSVLEAYRLFTDSYLAATSAAGAEVSPAKQALEYAARIGGPLQSAVSLPLMENAQRLCSNLKLLEPGEAGLNDLRSELGHALKAIQAYQK